MPTYQNIFKPLSVGNTNGEYEKIYNCRVINPTYETGEGLHNSEFFLDKRFGMKEFHKGDYHFTDDIRINGLIYYLYHNDTEIFVGVEDSGSIKNIAGPFSRNEKSPLRFAKGRGAKGSISYKDLDINNTVPVTDSDFPSELGIYEDGYIVLDVGKGLNIQAGDYVLFNDNVYQGATIEVDLYKDGKIYILGINARGSIPVAGSKITIYKEKGTIPVIGTSDGVYSIHIDGTNSAYSVNILPGDIEDIVSFNEVLFALKGEVVYFSQQTVDDNLQFYSSQDRKYIEGAYKLVSKGKFLIIFGGDNKLVSPVAQTVNDTFNDYSFYPLNYEGQLYSKYSYIFTRSSLYIVQSDKQIVNVQIDSLNATAFNFNTESITQTVRGLMNDIEDYYSSNKGQIFCNANYDSTKIHFFYQSNNGTTIEYEYDHQYKHRLLHTYEHTVYKKTNRYLCNNHVSDIDGFTDLGKEYEQIINYFLFESGKHFMFGFSDMIFGLVKGNKLNSKMSVEGESLKGLKTITKDIVFNNFDTLPADHSIFQNRIFNSGKGNQHFGKIASIRRVIRMSSRMFRVKLFGTNRFIYGSSNIFIKMHNPFAHEPENSF